MDDAPRLYDSYSDLPGAPANREGERLVVLEPGGQHSQPSQQPQAYPGNREDIDMAPQPETQPIRRKQPIAAYSIYDELPMIEAKFSRWDAKQAAACRDGYQPKVNNEQWQAPIMINRESTLLHSHSDVNPEDEYDQQQLRAYKEELRYRKL